MYELDNPYYFYLLLSLPLLLIIYLFYLAWRRKARKRFGDPEMLRQLAPERSRVKHTVKFLLALLILSSLSLALVNPKIGSKLEKVKREGVDIVFALDISKSMLAEDVAPNRMQKSLQMVSTTLNELVSDRVGIIIYAARAYPQLPITTDYSAARLFLKSIDTDLISSQGTAIAEAIELATDFYDDEGQKNRVLVIISDGEDHESGYMEAVEEAVKKGVKIYTIGVGTEEGAPIPEERNGFRTGYKRDRSGEVVISQKNSKVLKSIAEAGEGKYIEGRSSQQIAEFLAEEIAEMEKKEFETQVFSDYEDQFQWFLGFALLLLLIDNFVLARKTQWFKRLNLFEDENSNN